jgi:hypothetical protein
MKHVARAAVLLTIIAVPAYAGRPISTVPEPATMGLVATGVGVLGVFAWIKARKK